MCARLRTRAFGHRLIGAVCVIAASSCTSAPRNVHQVGEQSAMRPMSRKFEALGTSELCLRLIADKFFTPKCEWPETAAAVAFPCAPNPYSQSCVLLSVRSVANAQVDLVTQGGAVLAQFDLNDVAEGDYRLEVEAPPTVHEPFIVQLSEHGRVVGREYCLPHPNQGK